jgi:hypothetical protein
MAWDAYLNNVGWPLLLPKVYFSVHRSLLAGRDTKDPFAGVLTSSDTPHTLRFRREEIDVGKAEFGIREPAHVPPLAGARLCRGLGDVAREGEEGGGQGGGGTPLSGGRGGFVGWTCPFYPPGSIHAREKVAAAPVSGVQQSCKWGLGGGNVRRRRKNLGPVFTFFRDCHMHIWITPFCTELECLLAAAHAYRWSYTAIQLATNN